MDANLKKILKSGESETVEFKQSLAEKDQILETVSAFSNARGGSIYIGIDTSGNVTGVQVGKKTLESLANDIKLATDPKIFPSIEAISFDGEKIIQIVVTEHPAKPVWVGEKVFERVGKTNQRVPAERVRQLVRENQPFQWDKQVIRKASLSEIDSKRVKDFLRKVEEERNTEFDGSYSVETSLLKLHLQEKGKPTAAALLLFGKDPQAWFPQSEIRCARFSGTEALDFEDMTVVRGTIVQQVPDVLNFIRKHVRVGAKITGKPERQETWEYPKEALREAIVNAICHRDYEDTGNVQVRIFDNRIEVWNPGTLPKGLTIEDLKGEHRSQPHNTLIAECFYLIKYLEQWGTGTNRMLRLCKDAGLPEPIFDQKAGSFVVVFKRAKKRIEEVKTAQPIRLNETQKKIIRYLNKHKHARTSELQEYLGIALRVVRKNLNGMSEILVWSGKSQTDPTGTYSLKKGLRPDKLLGGS
jgi:ATP-dependent DNA helicase RecG